MKKQNSVTDQLISVKKKNKKVTWQHFLKNTLKLIKKNTDVY